MTRDYNYNNSRVTVIIKRQQKQFSKCFSINCNKTLFSGGNAVVITRNRGHDEDADQEEVCVHFHSLAGLVFHRLLRVD